MARKKWKEADIETAVIYQQIINNYLRKEGLYGLVKLYFLGQREAVLDRNN